MRVTWGTHMLGSIIDWMASSVGEFVGMTGALTIMLAGPLISLVAWRRSRGGRRGGWKSGPPG